MNTPFLNLVKRRPSWQDLTGNTFNNWTVLEYEGKSHPYGIKRKRTSDKWKCRCACGKVSSVYGSALKYGESKSCGCVKITRHYDYKPSLNTEFVTWKGMKGRCYNQNSDAYADYGGRGIVICDRWMTFENFLADMGKKPSPDLTIERIDNNGNYEPGNCIWATRVKQGRNTRRNHVLLFSGEAKPISQWAQERGIAYGTLSSRICRYGWPIEQALTIPTLGGGIKRFTKKGSGFLQTHENGSVRVMRCGEPIAEWRV